MSRIADPSRGSVHSWNAAAARAPRFEQIKIGQSKATIPLDTAVSGRRIIMVVRPTLIRVSVKSTAAVANPWQSLTIFFLAFRKSSPRGPAYGW